MQRLEQVCLDLLRFIVILYFITMFYYWVR